MTAGTGETGAEEALADTSVFVAVEHERPLSGPPPKRVAVSVITVGELRSQSSRRTAGQYGRGAWRPCRRQRRLIPCLSMRRLPTPGPPCAWHCAMQESECPSTTPGSRPPRSPTACPSHPRMGTTTTCPGSRSSESEPGLLVPGTGFEPARACAQRCLRPPPEPFGYPGQPISLDGDLSHRARPTSWDR